jgi:hypothetical protein
MARNYILNREHSIFATTGSDDRQEINSQPHSSSRFKLRSCTIVNKTQKPKSHNVNLRSESETRPGFKSRSNSKNRLKPIEIVDLILVVFKRLLL